MAPDKIAAIFFIWYKRLQNTIVAKSKNTCLNYQIKDDCAPSLMILQVVGCISRGVRQAKTKKYLSLSFLRPEAERGIEHYDLHETTSIGRIFILSLLPVLNPTHLVPCNSSLPSFFLCLTVLTLSLLRDNFDLLNIHSGFFPPHFLGNFSSSMGA